MSHCCSANPESFSSPTSCTPAASAGRSSLIDGAYTGSARGISLPLREPHAGMERPRRRRSTTACLLSDLTGEADAAEGVDGGHRGTYLHGDAVIPHRDVNRVVVQQVGDDDGDERERLPLRELERDLAVDVCAAELHSLVDHEASFLSA